MQCTMARMAPWRYHTPTLLTCALCDRWMIVSYKIICCSVLRACAMSLQNTMQVGSLVLVYESTHQFCWTRTTSKATPAALPTLGSLQDAEQPGCKYESHRFRQVLLSQAGGSLSCAEPVIPCRAQRAPWTHMNSWKTGLRTVLYPTLATTPVFDRKFSPINESTQLISLYQLQQWQSTVLVTAVPVFS